MPREPGIYRFWIERPGDRPSVYVGEAADPRNRMQFYRAPGSRMPTNLRLRSALTAALQAGSKVSVSTVTEAVIHLDGGPPQKLPLDRKNARLIVEQSSIAATRLDSSGSGPLVLDLPGVGEQGYE